MAMSLRVAAFATLWLASSVGTSAEERTFEDEGAEGDYSLRRSESGCLLLVAESPDFRPAEFKEHFLDQQPAIFSAKASPSTDEDTHQWSAESLSQRHGGSHVVLGSNKSLSLEGRLLEDGRDTDVQQLTLAEYLQPSGSPQPGYLFLTGIHASHKYKPGSFEATVLDEARASTKQWWASTLGRFLGTSVMEGEGEGEGTKNDKANKFKQWAAEEDFKQWAPVIAVGSGTDGGGAGGTGIPFHRHHASWLHLLHGSKLWHFYPPDVTPQEDNGIAMGGERGHSEWIANMLHTLDDSDKPLEYLQHAGETVYVPEAWWHATSNVEGGGIVVGVGGQAENPQPGGLMELANEMETLIQEQSRVKEALKKVREARDAQAAAAAAAANEDAGGTPVSKASQGAAKLAHLHGDVLLAVIRSKRAEGEMVGHGFAEVEEECIEAADAFEAAISAPGYLGRGTQADAAPAHKKMTKLLFDTANVQWCAGRRKQAGDNYIAAMQSDLDDTAGIKSDLIQNLLELATDHLNAGEIPIAIQRAGDAGKRGIPLLEHLRDIGYLKEDHIVIAACDFQLQRVGGQKEGIAAAPQGEREEREEL